MWLYFFIRAWVYILWFRLGIVAARYENDISVILLAQLIASAFLSYVITRSLERTFDFLTWDSLVCLVLQVLVWLAAYKAGKWGK